MLIVLLVASWIVRALDKTCGIGGTCELFLVLVASRIIMVSVLDRTCRIVGASDLFFCSRREQDRQGARQDLQHRGH